MSIAGLQEGCLGVLGVGMFPCPRVPLGACLQVILLPDPFTLTC